ncbi:ribosomal RNA processing protein 1 homolog A-like isoform X1 [Conger conger]|uniref:ribosomal RNA processing protein 1 homolog A-like isoform X1 n=1 Tax=Conger conger TaxID=82655 RepID=UPI002A5A9B2D|nr:ribosomal RNA processing protein 1 homolog A-like isoform X1 [Conger conger]
MASVLQEPEVQFAQRLASNEKSVRTKAIKKLRKYLSVRSQKPEGGFTIDELLKIWKGLFYCLWMQDKPIQQEELSTQISGLIHWLQNVDTQFLFMESFLMTINREWNGIDRLRMDKFYSLVRFVFRETFEMMKRRNWDTGLIGRFVELLSEQVLRSTSDAPKGVQFHILDIYMTELARVGSAQLTAEQNLTFIEPFCRTAAKTKDRVLVDAICSNIFHEIVDHAPFAIEDLMREVRRGGGAEPESDEEAEQDEETAGGAVKNRPKKARGKRVNGVTTTEDEEVEDDDDEEEELLEEEDELPDWGEESDVPLDDEGIGPVLQFDYEALAERLFELASRSNTPSFNRKKLYKLVKTFRNLSKGLFPQDDFPAEVSTDEDDDEMFGSRRKMRKRRRNREDEPKEEAGEEGGSAVKKRKVKRDNEKPSKSKQGRTTGPADSTAGPAGTPSDGAGAKKKKKRRKKKKKTVRVEGENVPAEEVPEKHPTAQLDTGTEQSPMVVESTDSGVKPTLPAEAQDQSQTGTETQNHSEGAVADVQAESQSETLSTDGVSPEKKKNKKRKKKQKVPTQEMEVSETEAEGLSTSAAVPGGEESKSAPAEEEEATLDEAEAAPRPLGAKKKAKRKNKKTLEQTEEPAVTEEPTQPDTGSDCADAGSDCADADCVGTSCADEQPSRGVPAVQLKKGKRKKKVTATQEEEATGEKATHVNGHTAEVEAMGKKAKQSCESEATPTEESESTPTETKKRQKKRKAKVLSGAASDFVKFQSPVVPSPLFCRQARGSPSTPVSRKQLSLTPSSESKKVTFGLKNNQTAEFRKTDRSLMVSPDGSSRVPFDPEQKPLFGVLKSPAAIKPLTTNGKNNNSATKGRPTAADFF